MTCGWWSSLHHGGQNVVFLACSPSGVLEHLAIFEVRQVVGADWGNASAVKVRALQELEACVDGAGKGAERAQGDPHWGS